MDNKDFYAFAKLTDLQDLNLTVRIASLQGKLPRKSRTEVLAEPSTRHWGSQQADFPDLYVTVRLYADNKPLSVPFRTAYRSFRTNHQWNEWITLPYKLCDLPLNAQLAFTVHDVAGSDCEATNIIGGTTLRLFGRKGTLKKAQQRLHLWPGVRGDGSAQSSTPSKVAAGSLPADGDDGQPSNDEMGRLEKLIKRHERGDLPRLSWLDKLAYRQIERVHAAETERSNALYLYVDMPRFELPIVYCEQEAPPPTLPPLHAAGLTYSSTTVQSNTSGTTTSAASVQSAAASPAKAGGGITPVGTNGANNATEAPLFTILDPDIARDNPVEAKHRRLVRSHRSGPLDRELKPNAAVRDELNSILSYPPTRVLTPSEADRIWSFRFYLTRDSKGLTKFLKSVVWSDAGEAKQATEMLLPMWAEPGLDDALELLGPTFRDARVRAYAVRQLERAEDEELLLYLLQLVQALKFDAHGSSSTSAGAASSSSGERERERRGPASSRGALGASSSSVSTSNEPNLADFLIRRSLKHSALGNNFYWYLVVECEDSIHGKMYSRIKERYWVKMKEAENGTELCERFRRQTELVATLSARAKELRSSKEARPKKIEKLRALLGDSRSSIGPGKLDPPIPLPLNSDILVSGILPEQSSVFKSNLFPMLLCFQQSDSKVDKSKQSGEDSVEAALADATGSNDFGSGASSAAAATYSVIFKNGDDLRQDQLVIQLFSLMDKLLRDEKLDLKITPYRVLATGALDGMVQFVPSMTIAAIMTAHGGSLLNYLRHHHPDESSPGTYGVARGVLDTFVRSCAGYCVVTYLLGVGDRHLDNLLLSPDGHFFHVDFGYILGRDPKPFPPPVKVCKEMVDGMGGTSSVHYGRFRALCFTAFTSLRKSANLILNLVALMVDANVPDIKVEPDKAVLKVQDKFRLDLSDDDAIRHFEALLNETSYLSAMFDRLHDVAQYFRQ